MSASRLDMEELYVPISVFPLTKQEFQLHISGSAFDQVVANAKICNTTEAPSRRAKAFARGMGLKQTRTPSDQGGNADGEDDSDPDDRDDAPAVSNFHDCNVRTIDGIITRTLALSKARDWTAKAEMLVYDKRGALNGVRGRVRGSLVLTMGIKRQWLKGGRQAKKKLEELGNVLDHDKPAWLRDQRLTENELSRYPKDFNYLLDVFREEKALRERLAEEGGNINDFGGNIKLLRKDLALFEKTDSLLFDMLLEERRQRRAKRPSCGCWRHVKREDSNLMDRYCST
ncbi:hypothetical protein DL546_009728 [Coniochaeta pulveracea]|uniref:Uncharacterized protein n=1 Tax=Coniochaeta pulveracea TaxID=177199 RepID=A0A420YN90_9PEZI|nr:hypothetical protein DL546_009728 [Coniochaeta pulveracea]